MFNLSKREHLESLLTTLRKKKYRFRIREKKIIGDSYISLTITNKRDSIEIKLIRKWTRIFGKHDIKLLRSDLVILEHLDQANALILKYLSIPSPEFSYLSAVNQNT